MTAPYLNAKDQTREDAPSTVGASLREARERLGLSLADVAAVTRIPRNMLEHLESDRFDEYSAPVFVRGHLMNYAREVRLDVGQILERFERQTGERPASTPTTMSAMAQPARQKARRASKQLRRRYPQFSKVGELVRPVHMVAVVLLLCALFASAFFVNGSSATAQNPEEFEAGQVSDDWALEKDTDQTKWLLEQPAAATNQGSVLD